MPGPYTKARPLKDVVVTEMDNHEAVLLHLETKMYYTLNQTGLRIWQLLNDGLTVGETVEAIGREFDVAEDRAAESTSRIIRELVEENLVEIIEG